MDKLFNGEELFINSLKQEVIKLDEQINELEIQYCQLLEQAKVIEKEYNLPPYELITKDKKLVKLFREMGAKTEPTYDKADALAFCQISLQDKKSSILNAISAVDKIKRYNMVDIIFRKK